MAKISTYITVATVLIIGTLTSCRPKEAILEEELLDDESIVSTAWAAVTIEPTETLVPTPTLEPPSVLTVCMGQEPSSLFLYGDTSASARGILQSIYDGPFDKINGRVDPVILQQIPSLANGDAELRLVEVQPGTIIMDTLGNWVSLQEGVNYRPSGCLNSECAQIYEGDQSISMDELVVRFRLMPDILWSDGAHLTADDSVFSFNVAQDLFGNSLEVMRFTQSYTALDAQTVEWKSVPGYQANYSTNFFSPLPQHLWGGLHSADLLTSEISARIPIGWGPYVIDEWTPRDHITLSRNENYFRAGDGLPVFDYLVFRFVENGQIAIDALLVGECDYVDETALTQAQIPQLLEAQAAGQIRFAYHQSASWEQAVFGITTLDEERLDLFETKEVRQAIAMCIDRQALIDELLYGLGSFPDSYLPLEHLLSNPNIAGYEFNPQAALDLLATVGWVDYDQDVSTPLTSVGVQNTPDGSVFEFDYLVPEDSVRQESARIVQESLAECGINVNLEVQAWDQFVSPGPDGLVFGRMFDMTQFGWAESQTAPCFLYLSDEIPGPYPEYTKGWGGGNLAGYSNIDFDQACRNALYTLPDLDENRDAHYLAQAIYADELPGIPLYWQPNLIAMRPDMCLISTDIEMVYNLELIESFDFENGCK